MIPVANPESNGGLITLAESIVASMAFAAAVAARAAALACL